MHLAKCQALDGPRWRLEGLLAHVGRDELVRVKKKRGYTVCSSGYAATDTS
jgi:hypothetical protein